MQAKSEGCVTERANLRLRRSIERYSTLYGWPPERRGWQSQSTVCGQETRKVYLQQNIPRM